MALAGVGPDLGGNSKQDTVTLVCLTSAISISVAKYLPDAVVSLLVAGLLGFLLIRSNPEWSRQLEELWANGVNKTQAAFKSIKRRKKSMTVASALGDIANSDKDEVLITYNSNVQVKRNVSSEIAYVVKKPNMLERQMTSKAGMKKYMLDRSGSVPSVYVKKEDAAELRITKKSSFTTKDDKRAEKTEEDEQERASSPPRLEEEVSTFENVIDRAGIVPMAEEAAEEGVSQQFNQFLFRRASGMLDLSGKNVPKFAGSEQSTEKFTKGVRPPLNIQIASDLHIEMVWNHSKLSYQEQQDILDSMIKPVAPYLVLAGDVGCPGDVWGKKQYAQFIEKQADAFEMVFVIAGNHEYYGDAKAFGQSNTAPTIHATMKQICSKFHNVVFLDRKCAVLDGVRLVGVTLWSDVQPEQENHVEAYVSDYKRIRVPNSDSLFSSSRQLTVKDSRAWHKVDVQFIEWQCRQAMRSGQDVVLISHHGPLLEGTSNASHSSSPIASAFSTDLSQIIEKSPCIKAWVFGHTHHCADFTHQGVRVVSNQHGYFYDRSEGYKSDFVLTI
jgi:hypothetical protein